MAHYTQVAPRLVIVQSFTYRGKAEEFSNRYSFKGPAPTGATAWKALADKVIAALRPCFASEVTFVRAYGYQPSGLGADWVHDYSSPGPPLAGSGIFSAAIMPGDVAATLRFTRDAPRADGKKVYIRKYFHAVHQDTAFGNYDRLMPEQQAAFTTFGTSFMQGTIDPVFIGVTPAGLSCSSPHADQWLTTRTLHRRGKRKATAPAAAALVS